MMFSHPLYPFTDGKLQSLLSGTRALLEESVASPLSRADPSPVTLNGYADYKTPYFSVRVIHSDDNNRRVGTLIVATIYLQLIQNRYMFRSFTVLHCSRQHCVQPVASDVEVVGYL